MHFFKFEDVNYIFEWNILTLIKTRFGAAARNDV